MGKKEKKPEVEPVEPSKIEPALPEITPDPEKIEPPLPPEKEPEPKIPEIPPEKEEQKKK